MTKITKTDAEWRELLTPEQYDIVRHKGTEKPFTGEYYHTKDKGTYICVACGNELFSSDTKYDSGSGWPSFYAPITPEQIEADTDRSLGMNRTEVMCSRCGAHLGHVFDDGPVRRTEVSSAGGPNPTGKRFCVNSASLKLRRE